MKPGMHAVTAIVSRGPWTAVAILLILVDEDGTLALASVSPEGLKVLSKAELLTSNAWTVPSLVGTRLYVRDRKVIMALDLGSGSV